MADDFDDKKQTIFEDDEPEGGVFRWMSAFVVLLAVAGFFGLAWYAYRNGGEAVDEKDVELVKADKTPVKEAPANPGGMQIPNQDKTVYGLISGKNEKPVVERILPAPEEPMTRGDTETWMSDSVKNKTSGEVEALKTAPPATAAPVTPVTTGALADAVPNVTKEQFNPAKMRAATEAPQTSVSAAPTKPASAAASTPSSATSVSNLSPAAAAPAPTPVPAAQSVTQAPIANTPAAKAPIPAPTVTSSMAAAKTPAIEPKQATTESQDSDSDEDNAPVAKAKKTETKSSTAPSGAHVQLGAYKSQGEAESNWSKIAKEFSDDLQGKKHYIVRADLGSKGVYYRLQVAPFDSSKDAEQFCLDFVSAGRGCFLAKGK